MTAPDGKTPLVEGLRGASKELAHIEFSRTAPMSYADAVLIAQRRLNEAADALAQTAAQLAECRADNASLRAGIEQVQIHQRHIQEELDAVIAERDAARERLREYDAKL